MKPAIKNDWLDIAEQNEIPLFIQQPEETEREYLMFCSYKDQYPQFKPAMSKVAANLNIPVSTVRNTAAKWGWTIRLQDWAQHLQTEMDKERQEKMVEMSARHIRMSAKLQEKLELAIDLMDVEQLTPTALNSLMKTAAELERKTYEVNDQAYTPPVITNNGQNKEEVVKKDDLGEVMGILQQAGLFGSPKRVGVEQTTRIIVDNE